MPQAIHISPIDNVVVALHPIAKGTLVEVDGLSVTALEDIPQGHKMAVKPIKNGENVIKYGFPIGHATADAAPGSWMHTHNVHTNLSGEVEYSYNPAPDLAPLPKVEPETFMGFRRKDGRAAIRNEIWIIPTVGCVNDIAKKIVADNQDLVTGSIEGLYTFTHPFGCSQTGHDHAQTRKLLAALVRHPNAAAVLVLHLGCENLQHLALNYLEVLKMNGTSTATLNDDGTGALWIIGDGIGKPSVATNAVGWTTEKGLCMSQIEAKKYQVTVVAGEQIKSDDINFKFFHQQGWGGEYKNDALSTTSDLVFIGDGTNERDAGNLGLVEGKSLENGVAYRFTVDVTAGVSSAVLTVEKVER